MSNLFKGVRCLTQEQYEELKTNGTITIDGETYLFEEDWLYVTPEDVSGIARNNKKRLDSLSKDYEATKLVVAENKNNITLLKSNYTTISNDLNDVKTDINNLIATSVTLEGAQTIKGPKTFTENIYLANADGTVDRISHINNNFIIYSGAENGVALLNIDEGLDKIYAFNKELAFKEDITGASGSKVYVNNTLKDSIYFDDDPQLQLNNKLDKVESSENKELVNVNNEGQLEKTTFTANHLHGLKEQDLSPGKNVLKLENGTQPTPDPGTIVEGGGFEYTDNTVSVTTFTMPSYDVTANVPAYFSITLKPNTTYTISGKVTLPVSEPDSAARIYVGILHENNQIEDLGSVDIYNSNYSNFNTTFTTTDATEYGIEFTPAIIAHGAAQISTTDFYDLQIEEGETATTFEPYKDTTEDKVMYASDLEKAIADVEHYEIIYDRSSTDSSINLGNVSGFEHEEVITSEKFTRYTLYRFTVYDASGYYSTVYINFKFGLPVAVFSTHYTSSDKLAISSLKPELNSTEMTIGIYRKWSGGLQQNSGRVVKIEGVKQYDYLY